MSEEKPKRRRRRKKDEATEAEPTGGAAREEGLPADGADDSSQAATGPTETPDDAAAAAGGTGEPAEADATDESGPADGADGDDAGAGDEPAGEPDEEAGQRDEGGSAAGRRRRRGSAETGPARSAPARRRADGDVLVRAHARYVRCAPRKARLVVDHIRGKSVADARAILRHTQRHAARDVLKLLESCVANAENNHELVADELVVRQAYVNEGPTIRRYRPRALGRATRINKRTSHMTLTLSPKTEE